MSEKRFTMKYSFEDEEYVFFDGDVALTPSETVKLLNEQQDTIKKLQDLCGESDGENAKLRLKNKELQEEIRLLKPTNVEQYEQIVQLQEENEQLRQTIKEYEYQIKKGYTDLTYEEMLEKESDDV